MTPGLPAPRASAFGLSSWLWWPVIFAGWGLAGVVMAGEAILGAPGRPLVADQRPWATGGRPGSPRPRKGLS